MRILLLAPALACAALLLTGCGGKSQTRPSGDPGFTSLPAPSGLLRQISGGGAGFRCDGSATDSALMPQLATVNGATLSFAPNFTPAQSDSTGLGYALYRFNTTGFTGSETVRCGWASPPASGTAWIGLGHVASDRWVWRTVMSGNRVVVPGGVAPYSAVNGDMLAVLLVTGTANPCDLSYIRLGNEPPQASLIATPQNGALPLTVDFDATSSFDTDGSVAGYEVDYGEGAGFEPLAGPTVQYQYTGMGTYTAQVRVTDSEGGTATASVQIGAGVIPNQLPVADLQVGVASALPGAVVGFNAMASSDPDGTVMTYEYDPEGDGTYLAPLGFPFSSARYTQAGSYTPTVRVTDDDGGTDTASQPLTISYGTLELRTLDSTAGSGDYCTLGVANGKLCVAYKQGGQLAFVRATTASGDNWFSPQLLAPMGIGCALASVENQPAIAYHDGDVSTKFVRANNVDGSSWAAPFTACTGVDSAMGVFPALAVINGSPAVTCSDGAALFSGNSWYAPATNSTGTTWGAKKKISAAGQFGACSSLIALSSGFPCAGLIRTLALDSVELQFAAATDLMGTNWNPPIPVVADDVYLGLSGGLGLVSTCPAMAYYDKTAGLVRFIRASGAAGLAWDPPQTVVPATQGGGVVSMAVVNSLPVIAYYDSGNGVRLSISQDTDGAAWNTPVDVDAAATVTYLSLGSLDSRPAMVYASGGNLKLARWKP